MYYAADCNWTSGRFTINDMAGTPRFTVVKADRPDGSTFVSVLDPAGDKLSVITCRYGPTRQEITVGDRETITVRHHGWFGRRYDIVTPAGEMTTILSDFAAANYEIKSSGIVRAAMSRGPRQRNLTIGMADGEDPVPFISMVLAIETIRNDRRDNQRSIPFLRLILMMIN